MAMDPTKFIWHNGKLVDWEKATVHVLSHALHYGSSVFEGIRAYDTHLGPAIFRLQPHIRRLFDSAKIYSIAIPFDQPTIEQACCEVVDKNGLRSAYLRPIAFRGYGALGVHAGPAVPTDVSIAALKWGAYLGAEAIEAGVDVCVSSWRRVAPSTIPGLAKAGGTYLSSQLIAGEASRNGFAEGIALDINGYISEGSGENIFIARDDVLYTPPLTSSILSGITRDTVMTLAASLGITVKEQALPREFLYVCDEVFMTGTAAEITPVRSVDRTPVGKGKPGVITKAIQKKFFGLFDGSTKDEWNWLTPTTSEKSTRAIGVA